MVEHIDILRGHKDPLVLAQLSVTPMSSARVHLGSCRAQLIFRGAIVNLPQPSAVPRGLLMTIRLSHFSEMGWGKRAVRSWRSRRRSR
jgi:hypothetical protein